MDGKGEFVGMLLSRVGDLAVYGSDAFITYLSQKLENVYGVKVF